MSKWLALAMGEEKNFETLTDTQQKPSKSPDKVGELPFKMVYDGCRREKLDKNSDRLKAKYDDAESSLVTDFKHGLSIGGRPVTWTSKVISLEDWRQLSDWEKHGPDGRVWNGKTQQWELLRS